MKKISLVFVVAAFLVSSMAFANDVVPNRDIVSKALNLVQVKKALENRSITQIEVSQVNVATTWTYTIVITANESGLGMHGPSSHPCYIKVTANTVGGFAGTTGPSFKTETVCAQN